MSGYPNEKSASNVVSIGNAEVESILSNLRALRDQIVTACSECGVILSFEKQAALHSEINETCAFLTDLVRHP